MDPSWSDLKGILCQHEEIVEGNSAALQHVTVKLGELDHIVVNLTNLLRVQTQRIDNLEMEYQYLRSLVLLQATTFSINFNQSGFSGILPWNSNEEQKDHDVPIDVEENSRPHGGVQEVPDNESIHL
jgi:hypothetical protein